MLLGYASQRLPAVLIGAGFRQSISPWPPLWEKQREIKGTQQAGRGGCGRAGSAPRGRRPHTPSTPTRLLLTPTQKPAPAVGCTTQPGSRNPRVEAARRTAGELRRPLLAGAGSAGGKSWIHAQLLFFHSLMISRSYDPYLTLRSRSTGELVGTLSGPSISPGHL